MPNILLEISGEITLETPRHILIKLKKTKHKGRILKAARNIQGKPHMLKSFQQKFCRPEGNGRIYLKY